jgi:hypothetical protein
MIIKPVLFGSAARGAMGPHSASTSWWWSATARTEGAPRRPSTAA